MSQLNVIFSIIAFYYECVNRRGKKKEVGWGTTLNQGVSHPFPETCHVCVHHRTQCVFYAQCVHETCVSWFYPMGQVK